MASPVASPPIMGADQITNVLATQSDWRAIAGLLALMLIVMLAALLSHVRSCNRDSKTQTAQLIAALIAGADAKTQVANALFVLTATISRIESQMGIKS
ncbi:MAG: hypothetical protein V4696_10270 [Pseudomonadota bacterium]